MVCFRMCAVLALVGAALRCPLQDGRGVSWGGMHAVVGVCGRYLLVGLSLGRVGVIHWQAGGVVQQHHVLAEGVVEVVRAGSCMWHLHPVTCHCCRRLNDLEVVVAAARAAYVISQGLTCPSSKRARAQSTEAEPVPARAEHAAGQKSGCTWRPRCGPAVEAGRARGGILAAKFSVFPKWFLVSILFV